MRLDEFLVKSITIYNFSSFVSNCQNGFPILRVQLIECFWSAKVGAQQLNLTEVDGGNFLFVYNKRS